MQINLKSFAFNFDVISSPCSDDKLNEMSCFSYANAIPEMLTFHKNNHQNNHFIHKSLRLNFSECDEKKRNERRKEKIQFKIPIRFVIVENCNKIALDLQLAFN